MWFRNKKEHRRYRPQLERLGERCLPAVTITPGIMAFGAETVRIVSNNASDVINIEDNGGSINVEVNGVDRGDFGGINFRNVEIILRGGDDELNIDLNNNNGLRRSYIIDSGRGNDETHIHIEDDVNNEAFINIQFVDPGGNDFVDLDVNEVDIEENSTVKFSVVMGSGRDNVDVFLDGDVQSGASLHVNIDTGRGDDLFTFEQSTDAEIDQGALDVNVRMQAGNDVVQAGFYEDVFNFGNIQFNVALGTGNDNFLATFGLDQFDVSNSGAFNLAVFGEAGNDQIRATDDDDVGETITIDATVFDIHFYGGTGRDTIEVFFDVAGGAFQGIGGIVIYIDGSLGNDTITLRLTSDGSNRFDVAALAGSGNDRVTFFGDEGGGETYLGGGVLLDGGFDFDTRVIEGGTDMDFKTRNFEA